MRGWHLAGHLLLTQIVRFWSCRYPHGCHHPPA